MHPKGVHAGSVIELWNLQAHLRGRKHKRRADVVGVRVQRPSSHYCKICDITTTSAQHMAMHVAGKVQCLTAPPRNCSMLSLQ